MAHIVSCSDETENIGHIPKEVRAREERDDILGDVNIGSSEDYFGKRDNDSTFSDSVVRDYSWPWFC